MFLIKGIFRRIILCAICVLAANSAFSQVSSSFWQTDKSQHFVVYYQVSRPEYISELSSKAEGYYNSIIDDLGFRRFDFWSWDNRAKIYLYENAEDFQRETERTSWSGAVVYVANRTIKTFVGQDGFFDSILPHELTHIIFREFVGQKSILPLWIDEGVASSQEKSYLAARLKIAKKLIAQNEYIKLDKFSAISNPDLVQAHVFYAQAASLVFFLVRGQGRERFQDFCRKVRDGVDWQAALFSTYRFSNFEEFEQAWKEFIVKQV